MQPIQIQINGTNVSLGSPLPTNIFSFRLVCMMPIVIPQEDVVKLKAWLNTIVDRLSCDYVEYNNVLVAKTALKKYNL